MLKLRLVVILLSSSLIYAFQGPNNPAIVPAKLIHETQPAYPAGARLEGIQGTLVLQAVINEQGILEQIDILSPLGYGFEESALAAVRDWRYKPMTLDGKPMKAFTEVTVNFTLNRSFDRKLEAERTAYNVAVARLQSGATPDAVMRLQALCVEMYPPALNLYGTLLQQGRGVPADADEGFRLIRQSAAGQFGPAMYQVAIALLQGRRLDKDPVAGLEMMKSAAQLGSIPAQAFMGLAYERGDGLPADPEKSRQNYRLCAAAGDGLCQFHLGKALLDDKERRNRDFVQAVAWLELASERGVEEAKQEIQQEAPQLTPGQASQITSIKPKLVHKR